MSLRFKISLLSALISGSLLLGFGFASWLLIQRERLAAVDREIRTLAARHPGWLANRANYERLTSLLEFTFGEQRKDHVILFIRDRSGTVLYRSPRWPMDLDPAKLDLSLQGDPRASQTQETFAPTTEPRPADPLLDVGMGSGPGRAGRGYGRGAGGPAAFTRIPQFLTAKADGRMWRFGVLGNAQTTLALGINYDAEQEELNRLRRAFLLALPLVLILVAVGGWVTGSRALRPLKAIADTTERVTARGLDQRILLADSDPEVGRLIRVLNGMMDRLEKSFHQATRFTADASHELKTPLAIMQGELDHALQFAVVGSKEQQVFGILLEETQRLKSITRNLLLLAQADSGQLKLSRENIDLTDLLENAMEDTRILAARLELTFETQIEPGLRVQGDPHLLGTAVHNLLGNAVKFNQPHGRIIVQARSEGGQIGIVIGNTGSGILDEDQPRIFERFFRGRHAGSEAPEGSGLGLSLTPEVLHANGGEIILHERL